MESIRWNPMGRGIMRTTESSIADYYEKKVDGDDEETYTTNELLEVIAHELTIIRFELQK